MHLKIYQDFYQILIVKGQTNEGRRVYMFWRYYHGKPITTYIICGKHDSYH